MYFYNKKSDQVQRTAVKGVFPHQLAFTLLIPLRNIFLSPRQLISRIELKDNLRVMEVGPGPGYFGLHIAKNLLTGQLVLADIQQEMLDIARKRITRKGLTNVEYYLCNGTTFQYESSTFDRIYMICLTGELDNREEYMQEFHRILKIGGILSVSEFSGDPDKLSVDDIKSLTARNGFSFYNIFFSGKNFTINFKK